MTDSSTTHYNLAQEYASYAQARMALGSAWAGVVALWPTLRFLAWASGGNHLVIYWVSAWWSVLGLLFWVAGRNLLARSLYRPFGWVARKRAAGHLARNLAVTLLVLFVGLGMSARVWLNTPSLTQWPLTHPDFPLWILRKQLLWTCAVLWVGLCHLEGWEDRCMFVWLAILGAVHVSMNHEGIFMSVIQISGLLSTFLLAPWLIVRGIREHIRFRKMVSDIQALPALEG